MKQNYKLGQLVEFKTTSSSDATGVIEAVVIRVPKNRLKGLRYGE